MRHSLWSMILIGAVLLPLAGCGSTAARNQGESDGEGWGMSHPNQPLTDNDIPSYDPNGPGHRYQQDYADAFKRRALEAQIFFGKPAPPPLPYTVIENGHESGGGE